MYAVLGKNRIEISVAEFYDMNWYDKNRFPEGEEKFEIDYGSLEIDVHRNAVTGDVGAESSCRYKGDGNLWID